MASDGFFSSKSPSSKDLPSPTSIVVADHILSYLIDCSTFPADIEWMQASSSSTSILPYGHVTIYILYSSCGLVLSVSPFVWSVLEQADLCLSQFTPRYWKGGRL